MNRVVLVGRLVKDPELKRTTSDIPVVQFTIAVNRPFTGQTGDRQADFISCVVWRQQAENLAKYMRKGNQIGVDGRLQVRTYEDQGGVKRYVTEVVCDQIQFLEAKGTRDGGFGDVNTYDIPSSQPRSLSNDNGNSFDKQDDNDYVDPFANLKTSSGVSDDDLPF